jgi:hypothetical protein
MNSETLLAAIPAAPTPAEEKSTAAESGTLDEIYFQRMARTLIAREDALFEAAKRRHDRRDELVAVEVLKARNSCLSFFHTLADNLAEAIAREEPNFVCPLIFQPQEIALDESMVPEEVAMQLFVERLRAKGGYRVALETIALDLSQQGARRYKLSVEWGAPAADEQKTDA